MTPERDLRVTEASPLIRLTLLFVAHEAQRLVWILTKPVRRLRSVQRKACCFHVQIRRVCESEMLCKIQQTGLHGYLGKPL
jgi:hypothetical protein